MQLASTWLDLVVGVDIHFELVPPLNVPAPFPHPFVGLLGDPLKQALDIAAGGPGRGPVLINGLPATNAGTVAQNATVLPHLPMPPGVAWAPVPMAPVSLGGRTFAEPGAPPPGNAIVAQGSKSVRVLGWSATRMSDLALSCAQPLRMPASVIALPKGPAVTIGGAPAMEPGAAGQLGCLLAFAPSLAATFARSLLRQLIKLPLLVLVGHPVCVATGRVLAQALDWQLPGPLPLVFERRYDSSTSGREGELGPGWSHPFEVEAWARPGSVRLRWLDGRELPFDTFARPGHVAHVGDVLEEPFEGLSLRVLGPLRFEVHTRGGAVAELAPCPSGAPRARLVALRRPDGLGISLERDGRGLVCAAIDSCGRRVELEHDAHGRLVAAHLPHPTEPRSVAHTRYVYSEQGDLAEVQGPLGGITRYEYDRHLLVRETDPTGLSFWFGYDGASPGAGCVHTWGPGGLYDHELSYAKAQRITAVRDSRGAKRLYEANALGLVTRVLDPLGAEERRAWDDAGRLVEQHDALGGTTRFAYDPRGNLATVVGPDARETRLEHDGRDRLAAVVEPTGARWTVVHDALGHLVSAVDPTGVETRLGYHDGELASVERAGARVEIERDATRAPARVRTPLGERLLRHDRRGRLLWSRDELGAERRFVWDDADRCVEVHEPDGEVVRLSYDAAGNLVEHARFEGVTRVVRAGCHRHVGWERGGLGVHLELDSEDDPVAVVDRGAAERHLLERDAAGRLVVERAPDGTERRYTRDAAGRIVAREAPGRRITTYRRDAVGRLLLAALPDGSELHVSYDPAGRPAVVKRGRDAVLFERDLAGRVVREATGSHAIESSYDARGLRVRVASSLGARLVRSDEVPGASVGITATSGDREHRVSALVQGSARRLVLRLPGEVRLEDALDEAGRFVARRLLRGREELASVGVERAPGGLPLAVLDPETGPVRFELDAHGRLAARRFPDARRETRVHDDAGNVYARSDLGDRRYGPGNRLLEHAGWRLAYDPEGRLVEKTHAEHGAFGYGWDAAGNLVRVTTPAGREVRHAYDPLRRLVDTTTDGGERRFVWDGARLLHELSSEAPPVTWVYLPGGLVPVGRLQAGRWWSVVPWPLGYLLVDESGAEVRRLSLDLWGAASADRPGTTALLPWRFPGQRACEATGLHYNRFRWYDPATGLYLSPDPLGLAGGTRPYAYVEDPLTQADPSGLRACELAVGSWLDVTGGIPGFGALNGTVGATQQASTSGDSGTYLYYGGGAGYAFGPTMGLNLSFGPPGSRLGGASQLRALSLGPIVGTWSDPLPGQTGFSTVGLGLGLPLPGPASGGAQAQSTVRSPWSVGDAERLNAGATLAHGTVVEPAADFLLGLHRALGAD